MRPRRFKAPSLAGGTIRIDGPEAIHALRVLRMKPGDTLVLFDGNGLEAEAAMVSSGRTWFEATITKPAMAKPLSTQALTLIVSPPKGERADWLVEKAAELGVSVLQWAACDRSEVAPGPAKLVRWNRKAVEAAKQSGRAQIMQISAPEPVAAILGRAPPDSIRCYGSIDPGAASFATLLFEHVRVDSAPIFAYVGPEGGFSPAELEAFSSHEVRPARLAGATLRVETAAIAFAVIWAAIASSPR